MFSNNIALNLLSGFLGALILFLFQKWNERRIADQKARSLCWVLFNDMSAILLYLYSNDSLELQIGQELASVRMWRDLTPHMIELLPPDLVKGITYVYVSFETMKNCDDQTKESFRTSITYNLQKLFKYMEKNDPDSKGQLQRIRELINLEKIP